METFLEAPTSSVESLDRVSRGNPWEALPILQQIINAEIVVCTLFNEKVYSLDDMRKNPMAILKSLFVMIRASEESETKSKRGKAVWITKRRRSQHQPLTARSPPIGSRWWMGPSPLSPSGPPSSDASSPPSSTGLVSSASLKASIERRSPCSAMGLCGIGPTSRRS